MDVFFFEAIELSIVFLLGCVGEILMEKVGHLNLGLPGIMCMGTAGGCFAAALVGNVNGVLAVFLVVLFACLFGAVGGAIYAFLTVTLRCNQNITGLALTIFGNGFTSFFISNAVLNLYGTSDSSSIISGIVSKVGKDYFNAALPFAQDGGAFVNIVFGHGIMVYVAIAIAIVASIILFHTRLGLNIRSIGESPSTADSAGLDVNRYKWVVILIGSAIAGLGGALYIFQYMDGVIGSDPASTIEGLGWLSVALVIFTLWRPTVAILGSFIFGALYVFPFKLSTFFPGVTFTFAQKGLFNMLPFVVTILVLIITSIRGKRENQAPAALGLPYFREDR